MKHLLPIIALGLLVIPPAQAQDPFRPYAETHDYAKWEKEVAAYEASDRQNPPPKGGILFIGSSTIRLWKTLADDYPNLKVINRGFAAPRSSTRPLRRPPDLSPRAQADFPQSRWQRHPRRPDPKAGGDGLRRVRSSGPQTTSQRRDPLYQRQSSALALGRDGQVSRAEPLDPRDGAGHAASRLRGHVRHGPQVRRIGASELSSRTGSISRPRAMCTSESVSGRPGAAVRRRMIHGSPEERS